MKLRDIRIASNHLKYFLAISVNFIFFMMKNPKLKVTSFMISPIFYIRICRLICDVRHLLNSNFKIIIIRRCDLILNEIQIRETCWICYYL